MRMLITRWSECRRALLFMNRSLRLRGVCNHGQGLIADDAPAKPADGSSCNTIILPSDFQAES